MFYILRQKLQIKFAVSQSQLILAPCQRDLALILEHLTGLSLKCQVFFKSEEGLGKGARRRLPTLKADSFTTKPSPRHRWGKDSGVGEQGEQTDGANKAMANVCS